MRIHDIIAMRHYCYRLASILLSNDAILMQYDDMVGTYSNMPPQTMFTFFGYVVVDTPPWCLSHMDWTFWHLSSFTSAIMAISELLGVAIPYGGGGGKNGCQKTSQFEGGGCIACCFQAFWLFLTLFFTATGSLVRQLVVLCPRAWHLLHLIWTDGCTTRCLVEAGAAAAGTRGTFASISVMQLVTSMRPSKMAPR